MATLKNWVKERLSPQTRMTLRRFINWPPTIDVGGIRDTVFLAGQARSGTGWIANVINYKHDYRYMYEPFARRMTRASPRFHPGAYLRPDDDDPAVLNYARLVLSGKLGHHKWVDQQNRRIFSTKRLIKETHANLWLRWLKDRFPAITLVMFLRHPVAVVYSRRRRGNICYLGTMLEQEELKTDHLGPFMADLAHWRDMSDFEQRTYQWCIEHYVPLRTMKRGEVHLAFYETLAEAPAAEIERLFAFLGRPFDDRIFAAVKRPSRVTRADAAIKTGESVSAHWQTKVDPADMARAMAIVRKFGLDAVYGEAPMPNIEGAYALLGAA